MARKTPEELEQLAQTDPEALEAYFRAEIDRVIESAPEHRRDRLRALQWSIDNKLNLCKDPTQRFNKMVEIFWEGFHKFQKANEDLKTVAEGFNNTLKRLDDERS